MSLPSRKHRVDELLTQGYGALKQNAQIRDMLITKQISPKRANAVAAQFGTNARTMDVNLRVEKFALMLDH
jgi:hypothetical protein